MPISIAIYGGTGIGKSLDVHRAFVGKTVTLLTERGGLNSVIAHLGITPDCVEAFDIKDPIGQAEKLIDGRVKQQTKKKGVLVVDSGSELGLRHTDWLIQDRGKQVQQAFYITQIGLRRLMRKSQALSSVSVWLFHEQDPETKPSGAYVPGGPSLPGKLAKKAPYMFDMILRAKWDMNIEGDKKRVYECDPRNADYIMKDRFGAAKETQPMNLKPIIAEIGKRLRRQ